MSFLILSDLFWQDLRTFLSKIGIQSVKRWNLYKKLVRINKEDGPGKWCYKAAGKFVSSRRFYINWV